MLQRGTTLNGVFGAKMMWNYLDDFKVRMAELPGLGSLSFNERLDAVFPRLKIIFMRRRDKVAQAVSLWKAIQTQQWRTESESDSEQVDVDQEPGVDYDYEAIEYLLNELHRWDARWEEWFHATGREPIRVFYDEFTVSRAATIGRVLDALGIDPPAPEGKKPMKRQADDRSKDWVRGSGLTANIVSASDCRAGGPAADPHSASDVTLPSSLFNPLVSSPALRMRALVGRARPRSPGSGSA